MKTWDSRFRVTLSVVIMSCLSAGAAGPVTTSRDSTLAVPAARLTGAGFPWATNLVGSDFILSTVGPATPAGGTARLMNSLEWVRRDASPSSIYNAAYTAAIRADGSVVVSGFSLSFVTKSDFTTICYAADGVALWTNRYDGPAHGDDYARVVATSSSGEVWVAGESSRESLYIPSDIVVIKYAGNGVPAWTNRFASFETNSSFLRTFTVDVSGNAYVAESASAWSGNSGIPVGEAISKLDPSGSIVWTKRYSSTGPDSGQGIFTPGPMALDGSGDLIIAGSSGRPHYDTGSSIVKFDGDGVAAWTNSAPGEISSYFRTLALDRAGNAVLAGDGWNGSAVVYKITKCSSTGVTLWTNQRTGPLYLGGYVPQAVPNLQGDIFFIGGSPGKSDGLYDVVKFDGNGVPLWTNQGVQFGSLNGSFYGAAVDNAGNLYLLGSARKPGHAETDIMIMKYSGDGLPVWTNRFAGSAGLDDIGYSIAVDGQGSIHVSGASGATPDFVTLKYSDTLVYTPPRSFTGLDTLTCTLTDRLGNSATGSVPVLVAPGSFRFELSPTAIRLTPEGLQFQLSGLPGTNAVVLEASSDLVSWQRIATNQPAAGVVGFLDRSAPSLGHSFYRASQEP